MTGMDGAAPAPTFKGMLIAVLIGCLLVVGIAEVVLRIVYPQWDEFSSARFLSGEVVSEFGPVVTGRPGFDGYFSQNNGDFRTSIRINAFGLRNESPVDAADGRIWVVGDSMTFGWGVEASEMYSNVTADISGLPTYNVASPGTDVCGYQALLARMPADVRPSAVVLGLIVENDIRTYDCQKMAQAYEGAEFSADYGFEPWRLIWWKVRLTELSALYNFMAVSVKRVGGLEAIFRMLGFVEANAEKRHPVLKAEIGTAAGTVAHEIDRLRALLPEDTPFAVLVVPAREELKTNSDYWTDLRTSVSTALQTRGIEVLDPSEAFALEGYEATHLVHDGHWTVKGHELAAKVVSAWVLEAGSLTGD